MCLHLYVFVCVCVRVHVCVCVYVCACMFVRVLTGTGHDNDIFTIMFFDVLRDSRQIEADFWFCWCLCVRFWVYLNDISTIMCLDVLRDSRQIEADVCDMTHSSEHELIFMKETIFSKRAL